MDKLKLKIGQDFFGNEEVLHNKINEIVDSHNNIAPILMSMQNFQTRFMAYLEDAAVINKLDYIDKLHYICKHYKKCYDCSFFANSPGGLFKCKIKNKSIEKLFEFKPEIDKAYNSLNKSEDKSAPNEPKCEILPENTLKDIREKQYTLWCKLGEHMMLMPIDARNTELYKLFGAMGLVVKILNKLIK